MKKIIRLLRSCFSAFLRKKSICRIEEINLEKNMVLIHCRGIPNLIKMSFDEIINDVAVLSNLSSKHASWIGYYYGKYYDRLLNQQSHHYISFSFYPLHDQEEYCITMVNRRGHLVFLDKNTNTLNCMPPIKIMINEHLITKFNSIQACYIGILSGISKAKILNRKSYIFQNREQLKLVK